MQPFSRFRCLLLLVTAASVSGAGHAADTAPWDADNLDQAASMVHIASKTVAAEMDQCQQLHPDQVFKWRLANFIWQVENKVVVAEAERIYGETAQNGSAMKVIDAVGNTSLAGVLLAFQQVPTTCATHFSALVSSKMDVKVRTPKAYAFLMASRPKIPDAGAAQERGDVTIGCMKGYANKGLRDFDKALAFCQCSTDLIYSALSASERKELFAYKGSPADVIKTSWMQKIHPGTLKCASHLR